VEVAVPKKPRLEASWGEGTFKLYETPMVGKKIKIATMFATAAAFVIVVD